ncbi:ATP-dependent RNA helicase vasa-like [Adelges cooleyi]|uniref:ATP-dependent RNA helicase vasa-like n=1 Tax=Adelges cooleyi TaxID=133065 RepID=UPI0021806966|nr:ATP-dependent RNA helicase vasa-like [Adelges cooleyi]XP_050426125.1 ATP-dependent RNA helicase vasa-like [Adelges cooleyi]
MEEENWDNIPGVNSVPQADSENRYKETGEDPYDNQNYDNGVSYEENGYGSNDNYCNVEQPTHDSWGNTLTSTNYDQGTTDNGYGVEQNYQQNYGGYQGRNSGSNRGYNTDSSNGYNTQSYGDENEGTGFRGRGRGGRGRGRGRGTGRKFEQNNDHYSSSGYGNNSEESEKPALPKPTYIPPEIDDSDDSAVVMVAGNNFDQYESIEVKVSGIDVPTNINSFKNAGLREILLENLEKLNYSVPTPVQKYSLPIILHGRDMMASAQTGSGKTAAFVLPILNDLMSNPTELIADYNHCEPQAVIMSPTRELTIQICEVVRKLSRGTMIKSELAYGGTKTMYQIDRIKRGAHILVATPGRLNDFVNRGVITFSSVRFFVLDEADRMLDLGFKSAIESVLHHSTMVSSAERQTLMFSATLPSEIQQMACTYLKQDYVFVAVGEIGGACKDVTQQLIQVQKFSKKGELLKVLEEIGDVQGTIVFVEQKRNADFIAAYLSDQNYPTTSIHGDREQPERELALRDFKTKKMKILVATSVAARGLDIKGVTTVINYDLPKNVDEYVHRIGRTGRLGNAGKAISFFDPDQDRPLAPELRRILEQAGQEIPDWLSDFGGYAAEPDQFDDIRTDVGGTSEYVQADEEEQW